MKKGRVYINVSKSKFNGVEGEFLELDKNKHTFIFRITKDKNQVVMYRCAGYPRPLASFRPFSKNWKLAEERVEVGGKSFSVKKMRKLLNTK